MLRSMTRKLFPFFSAAVFTVGCGKKITEGKTSLARSIENQELPSAYVISINGKESFRKHFDVPRNGNFIIPKEIYVRSGNGIGTKLAVTYNLEAEDSNEYEFKCTYHSDTEVGRLRLLHCRNIDGISYGEVGENNFRFYYGKYIRLEILEGWTSNLVIEVIHSVDWL